MPTRNYFRIVRSRIREYHRCTWKTFLSHFLRLRNFCLLWIGYLNQFKINFSVSNLNSILVREGQSGTSEMNIKRNWSADPILFLFPALKVNYELHAITCKWFSRVYVVQMLPWIYARCEFCLHFIRFYSRTRRILKFNYLIGGIFYPTLWALHPNKHRPALRWENVVDDRIIVRVWIKQSTDDLCWRARVCAIAVSPAKFYKWSKLVHVYVEPTCKVTRNCL